MPNSFSIRGNYQDGITPHLTKTKAEVAGLGGAFSTGFGTAGGAQRLVGVGAGDEPADDVAGERSRLDEPFDPG